MIMVAISFFLDSVYPGMLNKDGTNIGEAIINATEAFEDNGESHKMILLITDGENLQGDFKNMLKKVEDSGIKVFTAGVGTKNGEPIPIRGSKGEIESYVKNNKGNHVISKLDKKRLIEIASETGGKYIGTINTKGTLKNAIQHIESVDKKEQKSKNYQQKKERYDIFLIPALILICLGFILDQGKIIKINNKRLNWLFSSINNKNLLLINILLFSLLYSINISNAKNDLTPDTENYTKSSKIWSNKPNGGFWGNISFKKERYKKALEQYLSSMNFLKGNDLSKLYYNIGNVFNKLNDLKKSEQYYENAAALSQNDQLKSMIFYNQGLIAFKNQKLFRSC